MKSGVPSYRAYPGCGCARCNSSGDATDAGVKLSKRDRTQGQGDGNRSHEGAKVLAIGFTALWSRNEQVPQASQGHYTCTHRT